MTGVARVFSIALLPLAVALAGCGAFGSASPTPTPSPVPTVTPSPTPPPVLETASLQVAQGGVGVVRVQAFAGFARATFDGREFQLVSRPGGFWGVIAVGADQQPGNYPVAIAFWGEDGLSAGELTATLTVVETAYPFEDIVLDPETAVLATDPAADAEESVTRSEIFYGVTAEERLWSGPFAFPVAGAVTSIYGVARSYNGGPVTGYHTGADFALSEGDAVVAANAGRVAFVGELPLRGRAVYIDHGAGVISGYHHLSGMAVTEGQLVSQGDVIGFGGNTGLSSAPHLHWEIIVGGVEVDPIPWTEAEIGP